MESGSKEIPFEAFASGRAWAKPDEDEDGSTMELELQTLSGQDSVSEMLDASTKLRSPWCCCAERSGTAAARARPQQQVHGQSSSEESCNSVL